MMAGRVDGLWSIIAAGAEQLTARGGLLVWGMFVLVYVPGNGWSCEICAGRWLAGVDLGWFGVAWDN